MKITKNFKILISTLMTFILILSCINISYSAGEPFDIQAKSAILIDASTGHIIYEKNIHEKLAPASITKIMVLLLAMEAIENNKISLDDEIVVSSNAAGMGGSQLYLEEGEIQKVRDIIKAICLRSANDGAVALAEHIAGTEETFIKMMNNKAKELGMENTHFKNATGLDEEGHYTSAYDISIMSKELLKHPKIHDWLTLWMAEVKVGKEKDVVQGLVNTNKLIHDYKGANGIKTGYTSKAGHCLSASATRGSLTLISVVLGCKNSSIRFNESKKLLNYGFANYDSIVLAKKNEIIKKLPVSKGKIDKLTIVIQDDLSILVKKGNNNNIEKEVVLPDYLNAPVEKGKKVGEIIVKINNQEVNRVNLVTTREVEKANFLDMLKKMINNILGN
ncbi:D-alanyl-D-alanine carboxypeptidase family protein [Caldisalinibacter kiritimatiensis]|uniref:serine-type D-Ala-D-Ala carboxypeptidase n=1 Tax=Caldisalinibacter kiritimatiensis TaxID=1304284 RepID=R1CQY3_9FIRM|nr:D-alanyl-D-alanine carboxypeptidase family protein [Caldisalinibacter kiritimatiensis]EOD01076.1 D-alanyl-D-alanine carboxypeptidase [Caldisalinibacter kiritimatiensis]